MNAAADLATAARIAFVFASAPAFGGVLLLAIARLTGARWEAALPPPIMLRLAIPGAAAIGLAQWATTVPPHLHLGMHPLAVGARAILAAGALAFAGARLREGAGPTFAAVMLALYAAFVTPVATDWLLGQAPGHSVSAIGMMLFVVQIAAACALVLVTGAGAPKFRRDMGKLMVAAALGLGYLGFMDYLILWFGNLPARVGFYTARDGLGSAVLVWAALMPGIGVPIAALSLAEPRRGERIAGFGVFAALLSFLSWWIGGGIAGAVAGALLAMVLLGTVVRVKVRVHG